MIFSREKRCCELAMLHWPKRIQRPQHGRLSAESASGARHSYRNQPVQRMCRSASRSQSLRGPRIPWTVWHGTPATKRQNILTGCEMFPLVLSICARSPMRSPATALESHCRQAGFTSRWAGFVNTDRLLVTDPLKGAIEQERFVRSCSFGRS